MTVRLAAAAGTNRSVAVPTYRAQLATLSKAAPRGAEWIHEIKMPLAWDELDARAPPDRFDVRSVLRRLRALRSDPWARYWTARQGLAGASSQ